MNAGSSSSGHRGWQARPTESKVPASRPLDRGERRQTETRQPPSFFAAQEKQPPRSEGISAERRNEQRSGGKDHLGAGPICGLAPKRWQTPSSAAAPRCQPSSAATS